MARHNKRVGGPERAGPEREGQKRPPKTVSIPYKKMNNEEAIKKIRDNSDLTTLVLGNKAQLKAGLLVADISGGDLSSQAAFIVCLWITHKKNRTLTSLNVSDNRLAQFVPGSCTEKTYMDTAGIVAICGAIEATSALVKFDISKNNLCVKGGKALASALKNNRTLEELNISNNNLADTDFSGVNAICDAILTMRALRKLIMGNNFLRGTKAGKALCHAIATNTVLKELDLSSDSTMNGGFMKSDTEFVKEFATGLRANGALAIGCTVVICGLTKSPALNGKEATVVQHIKMKDRSIEACEVMIVETGEKKKLQRSNLIGGKNNGALKALRMDYNKIATKDAGVALGHAIASNAVLTDLNVSHNIDDTCNRDDVADFVKGIADGIKNNDELTKLGMAGNRIMQNGSRVGKTLAEALSASTKLQELDLSSNTDVFDDGSVFAKDFAVGLSGNKTMMTVNLSNNRFSSTEQARNLAAILERNPTLKSLYGRKGNETSIDMSGYLGPTGATMLAPEIVANGVLVSVNLLRTNIGTEQAKCLVGILKDHATLKSLCGNTGNETELDMSKKRIDEEGVIMLAPEIVANGALTSLNLNENNIEGEEAGKALSGAVASNTALKALDLSNQGPIGLLDVRCVKEFASGLRANRALTSLNMSNNNVGDGAIALAAATKRTALTSLNISKNNIDAESCKALADVFRYNQVLQELNISSNKLTQTVSGTDDSGVDALRKVIPSMKAIVSVNLLGNNIGTEQGEAFAVTLKRHPTLKSFCGNKGNETKLNMKNQNIGAAGVIMLVPEIIANERLTTLDIRSSKCGDHFEDIVKAIKIHTIVHSRESRAMVHIPKNKRIKGDTADLRQFMRIRNDFTNKFSLCEGLFEEIAKML